MVLLLKAGGRPECGCQASFGYGEKTGNTNGYEDLRSPGIVFGSPAFRDTARNLSKAVVVGQFHNRAHQQKNGAKQRYQEFLGFGHNSVREIKQSRLI